MKIVALLGSPRLAGNSAFMAHRFLDAARNHGAEAQIFTLNTLRYRGCQACQSCKTTHSVCVQNDDLTPVLEAVRRCDVLVLATPVYYGDVTGQMKTFIDRTYCYFTPGYRTSADKSRLAPGKKLVFIQTQGHPSPDAFADIFPRYSGFLKHHGLAESYLLRACGVSGPDNVHSRPDVLAEVDALAAELMGQQA